jgi:antitoxin component YwqK of YwqJK toxin-antitoxin module
LPGRGGSQAGASPPSGSCKADTTTMKSFFSSFFGLVLGLASGQTDSLKHILFTSEKPGPYREYYKTGNLRIEGTYKRADSILCVNCFDKDLNKVITKAHSILMRDGEWREYFENGQLSAVGAYKGVHETYSMTWPKDYGKKDGPPYFVPGGYSEEHLKDKTWKYYNENGDLISEEYYVNGDLADIKTYER